MAHHALKGLYVLTDASLSGCSHIETALELLKGGARIIQLRDKKMPSGAYYETALEIRKICSHFNALFIVNDRVDVAVACGADGVHLGQDDLAALDSRKIIGSGLIMGISTHSIGEAVRAEEEGADYIGFGPVFRTETKEVACSPQGLTRLAEIRSRVKIPIAAIGGIGVLDACDTLKAGADMIAVASALLKPGRISGLTRQFVDTLKGC